MKTLYFVIITITFVFMSSDAVSRDDKAMYSISAALSAPVAKEKLHSVKFYFANQKHPAVAHNFGEYKVNRKTNAFNKSDLEACNHVFISALISLQKRAQKLGGNAVINIKSNYRDVETASNTKFQCGAGNVIAGVALKGTVVTLK